MAPPGGGRNVVSPRFLRHFIVIGITPFSDDTMIRIFGTLLSRYLRVRALAASTPVHTADNGVATSSSVSSTQNVGRLFQGQHEYGGKDLRCE